MLMGYPQFRHAQPGLKVQNQWVYDYPSPIQLSKQVSFMDAMMSQKNKYNILKYFNFVFKLMVKNLDINLYIQSLPSPNYQFKTLFEWINALLNIIQKESGKIWQFDYEEDLNLALQLKTKIYINEQGTFKISKTQITY